MEIARGAADPPRFAKADANFYLGFSTKILLFISMKQSDGSFGDRLHHDVPSWVDPGAIFHIRIRCHKENALPLTDSRLAKALLESVRFYQTHQVWHSTVFLLMPDHLHALLSFQRDKNMSRIIGEWKHFHAAKNGVRWQENYFDHRLRGEGQVEFKYHYILNNPVAKGLCTIPEDWPWKLL